MKKLKRFILKLKMACIYSTTTKYAFIVDGLEINDTTDD